MAVVINTFSITEFVGFVHVFAIPGWFNFVACSITGDKEIRKKWSMLVGGILFRAGA